ncbi:MAG TPA: hypothetical protein VFQ35_14020, partial [Polyangiaceae bacterium]|nr:hypothetical protein [Polyangiaceae bacterium]
APSLAGLHLVDEGLWRVMERGLEKNLAARWQTADEFAAELAGWSEAHAARARRNTPRRAGPRLVA